MSQNTPAGWPETRKPSRELNMQHWYFRNVPG